MLGAQQQRMLISKCKGLTGSGAGLFFPVRDEKGDGIGIVRVVDKHLASDQEIVGQMTRWRKANANRFFTQFVPTVERTSAWLTDVILADMSRIMFIVEGKDGDRLGQFGLCGINSEEAQLDNGIRGEPGGHPHLFYFVELAVICFCFERLGIQRIFGRMFSNNIMAILLHKKVGFTVEMIQPLRKSDSVDLVTYDPVSDPLLVNTTIKLVTLALNKETFFQRYPRAELGTNSYFNY
jgi:RimJ/RimL family protein N-acetyltransferase